MTINARSGNEQAYDVGTRVRARLTYSRRRSPPHAFRHGGFCMFLFHRKALTVAGVTAAMEDAFMAGLGTAPWSRIRSTPPA